MSKDIFHAQETLNGEIHYYRADDVGGAVRGNHIDLCVDSHDEEESK